MAGSSHAQRLQVPRILWGALFASTFIYLFVLHSLGLLVMDPARPPEETVLGLFTADPMVASIAAAGLITAVLSFILPRFLHRQALAAASFAVEDVPDPDGSVMFRDRATTFRVFANPDAVEARAFTLFFTPYIIALALAEAIAIFGFLLGQMGFDAPNVLPFFVASWILFAIRFPTADRVLRPVEEAKGAKLFRSGEARVRHRPAG